MNKLQGEIDQKQREGNEFAHLQRRCTETDAPINHIRLRLITVPTAGSRQRVARLLNGRRRSRSLTSESLNDDYTLDHASMMT